MEDFFRGVWDTLGVETLGFVEGLVSEIREEVEIGKTDSRSCEGNLPLCRTYTNLTNLLECIEIYTNLTELFECCHTSCFRSRASQTRSYFDSTGV